MKDEKHQPMTAKQARLLIRLGVKPKPTWTQHEATHALNRAQNAVRKTGVHEPV